MPDRLRVVFEIAIDPAAAMILCLNSSQLFLLLLFLFIRGVAVDGVSSLLPLLLDEEFHVYQMEMVSMQHALQNSQGVALEN